MAYCVLERNTTHTHTHTVGSHRRRSRPPYTQALAPRPCAVLHAHTHVQTPVYFVWVQKLSYFTYAFSALLDTEFAKISFVDPATGDTVPGLEVREEGREGGRELAGVGAGFVGWLVGS